MENTSKRNVFGSHDHRCCCRLSRAKAIANYPVDEIAAPDRDSESAQENNQYSVVHSWTCLSRLLATSAFRDQVAIDVPNERAARLVRNQGFRARVAPQV
jgi:hypothetical protein